MVVVVEVGVGVGVGKAGSEGGFGENTPFIYTWGAVGPGTDRGYTNAQFLTDNR